MPKVTMELDNIHDTINRPVNIAIAKQIAERIGFDPTTVPEMANVNGAMAVRGSDIETDSRQNKFIGTNRASIEISEAYVDRSLMTSNVDWTEHQTIFRDERLGLYVSPHYRKMEVTVQMTIREHDRTRAVAMHSAMQTRIDKTVFNTVHDVKYNYNIPGSVMVLLMDTYRRREHLGGYGENLAKWFNDCFCKQWRITTASNGMGATVTIGEGQIRISGWFEDDPTPPIWEAYGDKEGAWTTTVNYKFWYDKPEVLVVTYPYITHNQMVPREYIDIEQPNWFGTIGARQSQTENVLQAFTPQFGYENSWLHNPGIPIPSWDDWLMPTVTITPHYMNMFRFMTVLNYDPPTTVDLHTLINFETDILPDWTVWPEAIAYLKATHAKATLPYRNVFTVQIYRWDNLMDMKRTYLDADLNVGYLDELSVRDNHHVVFNFLTDPSLLTRDAIIDLSRHWCFGYKWFQVLWPNIIKKFPLPDSTCMCDPSLIYEIIEEMNKELELVAAPPKPKWPLVGSFVIKTGEV